jgi:hypothetical protein
VSNVSDIHLTSQNYWQGALVTGVISVLLAIPLILVFRNAEFKRAALAAGLSSGVVWGVMAVAAFTGFWELYYRYIYPAWMRRLVPLDVLLYAAIGLGMWWLATRLPGSAVLWFIFFGALESLPEHLFGIYFLGILDKVPVLQGVDPLPALIFAFFEYAIYWELVAILAFGVNKLILIWRPA